MTDLSIPLFETLAPLEEHYIPHKLTRSVKYLQDAREPRKAWPLYPGLPSNLHSSALAIRALQLIDGRSHAVEINEGAAFVRQHFQLGADASPQDLVDAIVIAVAEETGERYLRFLIDRLDSALKEGEQGVDNCSTKILSQAAIAMAAAKDHVIGQRWADLLLQRQSRDTGCWPDTGGAHNISLAATAWAVRAMSAQQGEKYVESARKGANFLVASVEETGWETIADNGTYLVTLIARALALAAEKVVAAQEGGLSQLIAMMNDDGGWGVIKGEMSGVEYTALALSALFEGGAGRYVQCRTAEKMLVQLNTRADELKRQSDRLRATFTRQVEERCGQVIKDRQLLRLEVEKLKSRLDHVEMRLRDQRMENHSLRRLVNRTNAPAEEDRSKIGRLFVSAAVSLGDWRFAIGVAASALVLAGAIALMVTNSVGSVNVLTLLTLAATLITVIAVAQSVVRLRRPRRLYEERTSKFDVAAEGMSVGSVLERFRDATELFPADIREELVYFLLREGADMPEEFAHRFTADLLIRLRVAPKISERFREWIDELFLLPPSSRRAVLIQIRRSVL